MVDINIPNFITIGLMAIVFIAVGRQLGKLAGINTSAFL
jgi:hypothetical protein